VCVWKKNTDDVSSYGGGLYMDVNVRTATDLAVALTSILASNNTLLSAGSTGAVHPRLAGPDG
jgi:hypothetical protein